MSNKIVTNIAKTILMVIGVYIIGNEIDYGVGAVIIGGICIYLALAVTPEDIDKK